MRTPWIVGVSGASGTPYAAAVLRGLFDAGLPVDLVVSRAARLTLLDETGRPFVGPAAQMFDRALRRMTRAFEERAAALYGINRSSAQSAA